MQVGNPQYCKFGNFLRGLYFREISHMRSFVKIKPSRNGKTTREFFTSLICLLMLFATIKFSRKFQNLQYLVKQWFCGFCVGSLFCYAVLSVLSSFQSSG